MNDYSQDDPTMENLSAFILQVIRVLTDRRMPQSTVGITVLREVSSH